MYPLRRRGRERRVRRISGQAGGGKSWCEGERKEEERERRERGRER